MSASSSVETSVSEKLFTLFLIFDKNVYAIYFQLFSSFLYFTFFITFLVRLFLYSIIPLFFLPFFLFFFFFLSSSEIFFLHCFLYIFFIFTCLLQISSDAIFFTCSCINRRPNFTASLCFYHNSILFYLRIFLRFFSWHFY